MRRAAYVGASIAASAAVMLRAFHERPNFYSAAVYLGQSTACRMILLNMLLIILASSMYALQRLLYGPLRAIEIEQLWDKAWYAITETALAMTTFRDEVGGYFFLMFMTLLAGKVWGWIGEGRVESLEQQPPADPRTFHARLIASLLLSEAFDMLMLRYCARVILDQSPPRAGMMVMFVFEFAILAINSSSTLARYGLALQERYVIYNQTSARIQERKEELRIQREENRRRQIESGAEGRTVPPPEPVRDDEIDENEIDVPGWQEKGRYILFLDLLTDFLKLLFYLGFFLILIIFAGIPIHMFRDLYMTTRSFIKRISDYVKYRNATRDMNTRYPDATSEELERDGTCIICREEMRPWQAQHEPAVPRVAHSRRPLDERRRPKKLPCGHILHVGCLRSWLERQQVCPTCRRSVLAPTPTNQPTVIRVQDQHGLHADQPGPNNQGNRQADRLMPQRDPENGRRDDNGNNAGGIRARTFNFGGFRLTFATGNARQVRNALENIRNGNNDLQHDAAPTRAPDAARAEPPSQRESGGSSENSLQDQLMAVERRILGEIGRLNASREQLSVVRALENEFSRLRAVQAGSAPNTATSVGSPPPLMPTLTSMPRLSGLPTNTFIQNLAGISGDHQDNRHPQQQVFSAQPQQTTLRQSSSELPAGMTIPEGWSMLPLQRMTSESTAHRSGRASQVIIPQAGFPQGTRSGSMPPLLHGRAEALAASTRGPRSATPQPSSGRLAAGPNTMHAFSQRPAAAQQLNMRGGPVPGTASASATSSSNPFASSNPCDEGVDEDPQLVTGLPDWVSMNHSQSRSPRGDLAEPVHEHEMAEGARSREEKGKGRAATVEEATDHGK